jgi:hypothetical protein
MGAISYYVCGTLQKMQIWLVGMELIIKMSITKIILRGSCSLQIFIVEEWSLPSILEATFFGNFTESLIDL